MSEFEADIVKWCLQFIIFKLSLGTSAYFGLHQFGIEWEHLQYLQLSQRNRIYPTNANS